MTVEQLTTELRRMPIDAEIILVVMDGTEETYINDFSLKREGGIVLLIEKSS